MADDKTALFVIRTVGDHPTIGFAAEELAKYLRRLSSSPIDIHIEERESFAAQPEGAVWLGEWPASQDAPGFDLPAAPTVADPKLDDAYALRVRGGQGAIVGTNPRSVLLGVYRFLTEAGCRWVRPGPDGEYIPRANPMSLDVSLEQSAAYRHRGICIEGAVSYGNVADIIDWAPKVGFNAYFFQFREAYTFFDRWYSHQGNPLKTPEPFSVEKAREYLHRSEQEIAKRDLLYHAVGHGWTCEPFGIPGLGWDTDTEYHIEPEVVQYLAEVNGKRELWHGIPLNTNLCYSTPEVRRIIVEAITDYLVEKPGVDLLHFWLADGANNQCECANCRQKRPSDYYVMMLNELDASLTERGIEAKVVFLIYVDLLWPPEEQRIENPERFVLMFAPITRSYSEVFAGGGTSRQLAPYVRNKLEFPSNVDQNVAFLRAWRRAFVGDSFDFDYHFMWDHYNDPGYYDIARLLSEDIKHLRAIGLNGYMSCQVQRAFFPTGLGMYVMGRTLWDDTLPFEALADEYMAAAFGRDGAACRDYLSRLSTAFDPPYLRRERPAESPEAVERYRGIPELVEGFRPVIERNTGYTEPCQALSWRYLGYHAEYCILLAKVLEARASGDRAAMEAAWGECTRFLQANEDALQPVLDVLILQRTLGGRLIAPKQ